MNRVLVTGLGSANELGVCEVCGLDFTWLASNPSTLLWADEICIPKGALEKQKLRCDDKTGKVIGMFLEMAEQQNLIWDVDLASMYQPGFANQMSRIAQGNAQLLLDTFPSIVRKGDPEVPDEILIEDEHYCGAWMTSICLDINIAKDLDANCLFSKREHTYLKYLYGVNTSPIGKTGINDAYNEVFSLYLPESLSIHTYAFTSEEKCITCRHHENCKEIYLDKTEAAFKQIFEWRQYDELQQAKEEIEKIIKIKGQITSKKDIDDVVNSFKEKQKRINYNINKVFPKIERWTKMTTVLATPATIAAAVSENIPLVLGTAAVRGVAEATEAYLDAYRIKNNWVGFVNSMKES